MTSHAADVTDEPVIIFFATPIPPLKIADPDELDVLAVVFEMVNMPVDPMFPMPDIFVDESTINAFDADATPAVTPTIDEKLTAVPFKLNPVELIVPFTFNPYPNVDVPILTSPELLINSR